MDSNIPPQFYETLKKVVNGNIENFRIIIHNANKKGDGFLGEVIFVTLEDKTSKKALDVVVKQAFIEEGIRSNTPIREAFMNEIYFYSQVWTRLNKFQQRIPPQYQFHKLPRYLASVSELGSEKVVLENLKFQDFELHDKRIPLDGQYFELIFKEYGKFHALSLAYKALHPEDYSDLVSKIVDVYAVFIDNNGFRRAIKMVTEPAINNLDPGTEDAVIEKFRPYVDDYVKLFKDSIDSTGKYTVITHGDCWSNNMMFKYSETRKLVDVRFLDFQLFKVGSPCCDLAYSFYSGASTEALQNLDHYLKVYHDSLSATLSAFGCDSQKLFPFQELRTEWKRYCKMGVMMGLMIWKIKCTSEENVVDLKNTMPEEEREKMYRDGYDKEAFKKVTRSLVLHLYENDFL